MGPGEASSGGGEKALQVDSRSVEAPAHAPPAHESAAVCSRDCSGVRGLAVTQARGGGDLGEAVGDQGEGPVLRSLA